MYSKDRLNFLKDIENPISANMVVRGCVLQNFKSKGDLVRIMSTYGVVMIEECTEWNIDGCNTYYTIASDIDTDKRVKSLLESEGMYDTEGKCKGFVELLDPIPRNILIQYSHIKSIDEAIVAYISKTAKKVA